MTVETIIAGAIERTRSADAKADLAGRAMAFDRWDAFVAGEQREIDKEIEALYGPDAKPTSPGDANAGGQPTSRTVRATD
jgi:hypothetical protein